VHHARLFQLKNISQKWGTNYINAPWPKFWGNASPLSPRDLRHCGGRFQTGNSYNSDVDWAIATKFGLLIDNGLGLLKRTTSSNLKPKVKLRLSVRHLENRYNITTVPKMVRFGWNSTAWCRLMCPIQWYGRSQNRKENFNMADDCFLQTGNSYISAVDWVITTKYCTVKQNSMAIEVTWHKL